MRRSYALVIAPGVTGTLPLRSGIRPFVGHPDYFWIYLARSIKSV